MTDWTLVRDVLFMVTAWLIIYAVGEGFEK